MQNDAISQRNHAIQKWLDTRNILGLKIQRRICHQRYTTYRGSSHLCVVNSTVAILKTYVKPPWIH